MLGFLLFLEKGSEIRLKLLRRMKRTFVLEFLAKLLEVGKTDIAEQGLAGMDICPQQGHILILVRCLYFFPVGRQIA